jgi:hypothetical protein
MGGGPPRSPETGWAAIRPTLVAFLLAADAFVVISLAALRPSGWLPPFAVFGSLLVGLVWFEAWAIRHRHDDDPQDGAPPTSSSRRESSRRSGSVRASSRARR